MRWAAAIASLSLLACTDAPELEIVATRELGPLVTAEGVVSREHGASLFAFGRSVWLFGDTMLAAPDADGRTLRSNGWSHTIDVGARDGVDLFETPTDAAGGPAELFTLTAEELAYAEANAGTDARVVLWPLTGVRDDANDRVLLFYAKRVASSSGELTRIGSSIAVWTELEFGPVRPVLDAQSEDPTLLFRAPEAEFGQAALILDDHLYAYACTDELYHPCTLARAELGAVFERDAWTFWTGHEWSPDSADGVALLEADTVLSIDFNPHLRRYLAFYAARESGEILVRAAPLPEGPWTPPISVFRAEDGIADVLLHPEYRRGGGQFELLSYRVGAESRLLEVELAPGS